MNDTERLIKFMREQADASESDGLAQWFTATANELIRLRSALAEREIPLDALHEAMGGYR